jgi:hypothetical protein
MSNREFNPFPKSTAAEDDYIKSATSPSDLREKLDTLMKARGIYSRGQSPTFDTTTDSEVREHQTPPSVPSLPAESAAPVGQGHLMRVFYIGNSRFEIYSATSEGNLDEQEQRIRSLYR